MNEKAENSLDINIAIEDLKEPMANPLVEANFKNYVYCTLNAEDGVKKELSTYFAITIPNFHLLRKFNKKFWNSDGKIRLYNLKTNQLPVGLLPNLYEFCKDRKYRLQIAPNYKQRNQITNEQFSKWVESLNLPLEPYDYQLDAVRKGIQNKRLTAMVPTGGGKSLIIYMFIRWCLANTVGKILIIVPTTTLVEQLTGDFASYGGTEPVHKIMAGISKEAQERIFISTWQSLYLLEESYFEKFETIVCDEAHSIKPDKFGRAIIGLIQKTHNAHYRLGTTGTIENTNMHRLQIEGVFGTIYKPVTTKELIDRGLLSGVHIKAVKLKYPEEVTNQLNKLDWQLQQDFVESIENPRQQLIVDLAISLKENCLILFRKIEHGTYIYEELLKNCKKEIYYVDGSVSSIDRNDIRKIVETKKDAVIVASIPIFSVGVNLRNLHHLILATSTKSTVRLFQSIGRSLRLHETKDKATIYDFADEIYYLEKHYQERKRLYDSEQLTHDEREVDLCSWAKKKNISFFN